MNKKILEILSRATPANDDNKIPEALPAHKQFIKYSLFNKNNIAKNGNITIISLNGILLVIFLTLLFFRFFQQTI